MTTKSIGQVAEHKPLCRYNMEELAARQMSIQPSSGVLFTRNLEREKKDAARQMILNLFKPLSPSQRPEQKLLRILTMPGLQWRFERKLLGKREGDWDNRIEYPRYTRITSVENDRAIYYGAITKMPGLQTNANNPKASALKPPPFAEQAFRTRYAKFLFCDVDDLMKEGRWTWDAAWLDYTGPLTVERLNIIADFYRHSVTETLIVTALKARWNTDTVVAIREAGGHSAWLRQHLFGDVLHDLSYFDTAPMVQFAIRKPLQLRDFH